MTNLAKQIAQKAIERRRKINKKAVTDFRQRQKLRAVAYKGGKCIICGYDRCPAALVFHHTDPSTKGFGISKGGTTRSWDRVKEELQKCVLLCSNCHLEVHAGITELPPA